MRAGHIAEASWDHANTNNMTLFYHVILNDQTVGRVREPKTLIELSQCEEYYKLRVDVEDVCNKVSVGDPVQFSCPQIGMMLFYIGMNVVIEMKLYISLKDHSLYEVHYCYYSINGIVKWLLSVEGFYEIIKFSIKCILCLCILKAES